MEVGMKPLKILFVSLLSNLLHPGRCESAQKLGKLGRTESCMLKFDTV